MSQDDLLGKLAERFAGQPFVEAVRGVGDALQKRGNTILADSVEAQEHVQAWLADPCEVNERLVRVLAEQLGYRGIWGAVCAAIVWREGANMIDPSLGVAPAPKGLSEKMLAAAVLSAGRDDPSLLSEYGL